MVHPMNAQVNMNEAGLRAYLRGIFDHAVASVHADRVLPPSLPDLQADERVILASIGKAAGAMALAFMRHHQQTFPGLVLTRYGHLPAEPGHVPGLQQVEASHPVPDAAGRAAATRLLQLANALGERDHLVLLLSGGASSLLTLPIAGLAFDTAAEITARLLVSGARIQEINCVRRHLSCLSGGRLAVAAAPARITARLISDVVGDTPCDIGSGPVSPDPTSCADARAVLERYQIAIPRELEAWWSGPDGETPAPGDPAFERCDVCVIASADLMLAAVSAQLRADGYDVISLGAEVEGEASEVARAHGDLARSNALAGRATAIVSGGELTVTLAGSGGRGGPSTEYLLALALALDGTASIAALACDSDGIDGSQDNAGAFVFPSTIRRAVAAGLDPEACLCRHDSYGVFKAIGDLVETGPTLTNVNDIRIILVDPQVFGRARPTKVQS